MRGGGEGQGRGPKPGKRGAKGPKGGGPEGGGPEGVQSKGGARRVGPRRVGAPNPEKWCPEGWGPKLRTGGAPKGGAPKCGVRRVGGPKFSAFFSLSRPHFRSFSHDNPRTPNVHISGPGLQKNTIKIQREDTRRDRKRTKWERERGKKKSEILGGPAEGSKGGPASGGLAQGGPGESKPTTTTTTITTTTPTPPEMEGRGQTQKKCGPEGREGAKGPEGWGPEGLAQRVGLPPPRFWVWVCRVWGSGLN